MDSWMRGTVCLVTDARLDADAVVTYGAPIRSNLTGSRPGMSRSEIVFDAAKRQFDVTEELSKLSNVLIFHGQAVSGKTGYPPIRRMPRNGGP